MCRWLFGGHAVARVRLRLKRPVPDQISGSDLDGDEYFVSWEPQLIPAQSCPPADYGTATEVCVAFLGSFSPLPLCS